MEIRLVPALLVFAAITVTPSDAHAFGSAWKGIKWTGRQAKKILPPYGGGLKCDAEGNESFNGCYYDDINLTQLKVVRGESAVDFDWQEGSPDSKIAADTFSARFVGNFEFDAADYTFTVTADDGVRLYMDNQLLIDQWNDHGPTTFTATRSVSAGRHKIIVQYYENLGGAMLRLNWSKNNPNPGPGPGPAPGPGPILYPPPAGPPNDEALVKQVDAANPGLITECIGRPIANDFLIQVVNRLQQKDPRWGYFRKPDGRIPRDILAYAWGSETEGTHNAYIIDFVANGCGNSPNNPEEFNAPQPNARVWWNVLNKDNGFADNGVWTFRP